MACAFVTPKIVLSTKCATKRQEPPVTSGQLLRPDGQRQREAALNRLQILPVFPSVAAELLSVSPDCDGAVERLLRIVKSDPTVAADLLRVANSSEFCTQSRI